MTLQEGLEILVKDWQGLHEEGGTNLTAEQVLGNLSPERGNAIGPGMKPAQLAEIVMAHLRRSPEALAQAEAFMAQFLSAEELLDEVDLDSLVSDLAYG